MAAFPFTNGKEKIVITDILTQSIIGGDRKSINIAAASIVALRTLNSSPIGRAEACVLGVLQSTPGVSSPQVVTSKLDEWDRPYLEYFAGEKAHWYGPTRFYLQKSENPGNGPLEFWVYLFGLLVPGEEMDLHITDIVMRKWQAQCGVHPVIVFP